MGPVQSHYFTNHYTETPHSATYTYTRSNRFGAVESRHTIASPDQKVRSMITFSDGHGYVVSLHRRGCLANNLADYYTGAPQDGFYEGNYGHLVDSRACTCGKGCSLHQAV
uniref:Uncharacterized protein n=1 Tax=viral metagenome TaxID=1070528 RepID=A0A6C0ERK1_9ZZZZ